MKLSKAIEGFLLSRAADGYAPATIDIYRWGLEKILNYVGDIETDKIDQSDLQRTFSSLREENLTERSIENVWTAMRSFYNWAAEELDIERNDRVIHKPRYKPAEIIPFDKDEIQRLMQALDTVQASGKKSFVMRRPTAIRDRAIFLTLLDTGVRVSELCRIKVEDVNMETGEIFIIPWGTGRKTRSRVVVIGTAAKKAIWRYLAKREKLFNEDPLFLSKQSRPLNRNAIRKLCSEAGKRADVRNCHPHRFRHTFAILFLRNGGDVFTLQRLLGHSSLEMVRHYLNLANTDILAAHHSASPVDRWRL